MTTSGRRGSAAAAATRRYFTGDTRVWQAGGEGTCVTSAEERDEVTRLVIVADDLTGAADSAALMTRRGPTAVVTEAGGDWSRDVIVSVDTDSRHCEPDVAAARVAAAARQARQLGAEVFKKVDSTLRGNIAAELRAVAEALAVDGVRPLVVLAPAFPALGRTTVHGVVHVDGAALAAHGIDGDVAALLQRGGLRTRRLGVEGPAHVERLATAFDRAQHAGLDAVVVDGETDEQLRTVVDASRLTRSPVLLAGSGGLARPLAESQRTSLTDRSAAPLEAARDLAPELVVVGSHAEQARAQRQRLVAAGIAEVLLSEREEETTSAVRRALLAGPVLLSPDPARPVVRDRSARLAQALSRVAAGALDRAGTLVVTGGETARAVLVAAGASRLVVLGEREPGIVHSFAPALGLHVVTKAGAFGDADALLRCLAGREAARQPEGADT
jgi:D-threonate/D-erythronate kinase